MLFAQKSTYCSFRMFILCMRATGDGKVAFCIMLEFVMRNIYKRERVDFCTAHTDVRANVHMHVCRFSVVSVTGPAKLYRYSPTEGKCKMRGWLPMVWRQFLKSLSFFFWDFSNVVCFISCTREFKPVTTVGAVNSRTLNALRGTRRRYLML